MSDAEVTKRRDRHDIIVEILKTARNGKIKTHIMYKARLSYTQINEYLPLLIEKGFLEHSAIEKDRKLYRTTKKGLEFLDLLESTNKLWEYTPGGPSDTSSALSLY